jgi:hypothetical protein
MIKLTLEEAGEFTLRPPSFAAYAAWFDAVQARRVSDASQNLVIDCAVEPGPEALAALFEEYGGLPETLTNELLARVGTPGGGADEGYPCVRLADARKAHSRAGAMSVEINECANRGVLPLAELLKMTPGLTPEELLAMAEQNRVTLLARELELVRRTLLPVELLDAAERVTRRALIFTTPAGLLALRPPNRDAAASYVDAIADVAAKKADASYLGAGRALMLACAISPDAQTLAAAIESYPALAQWIPPVLQAASSGGKAIARP